MGGGCGAGDLRRPGGAGQAARADATLRNEGSVEELCAAADAALLALRAQARAHVTRVWAPRPPAT